MVKEQQVVKKKQNKKQQRMHQKKVLLHEEMRIMMYDFKQHLLEAKKALNEELEKLENK